MKNNIINKLILGSFVLISASCTDNYMNINSNPYQPGDLTTDDYILGSAMSNLASSVVSTDVNTTQFTDCLLGCPLGGYFADSATGWSNTISNFDAKNDWTRVFLMSDKVLPVLYGNLSTVKTISEQTNNPVPYAIALIIKVAAMSRVTDTYGAIPYSQIGEDGKITIPYDSQEKVYIKFFEELNEAIKALTENKHAALSPTADYVYSGNVQQWIKFGNSLKLRLAIRIAYANYTLAQEMAESAITQEFGVIESNSDNAQWNYFNTIANPIFTAVRYNEIKTGGDSHAAADIISYMNGYKDNRRASFFEPSTWPNEDYVGLRRSIDITSPSISEHFIKYSKVKASSTDPIVWMNAAEVAFLRAEGKAIFKFDMGGEAETFYNQGIRLSFEQWGASGAEEYLKDDKNKPNTYVDPAGLSSYDQTLSDITVKWDKDATEEEMQERIIIQKWIANWKIGHEGWSDLRRTGYPHLIPAKVNRSGGVVDSQKGAQRMPYPSEEYTSNATNVEYAVANYLKGADNMGTNVWWACKPGI